jgi:hypothetical protein
MVSINDVRETVLAICNKNNYGYISPDDFNLYAKQAQLDIFNGYMNQYNYYINLENQHTSGSDLADLAESVREEIEMFISSATLTYDATSTGIYSSFNAPDNWYHINVLTYTGGTSPAEIAKGSKLDITRLANSNLTAPTTTYPMYVMSEEASPNRLNGTVSIIPNDIQTDVECVYMRYPVDPLWDYENLVSGEPMYNAASTVDFELSEEEESSLVDKILKKAGLSIREPEVYNTAAVNDNQQQ